MDDVDKFYVWFKNKKDNEWSFCTNIQGERGSTFYGWQYRPDNSEFMEFTFHPDMVDPSEWARFVERNEPKLNAKQKLQMVADIFSISKVDV